MRSSLHDRIAAIAEQLERLNTEFDALVAEVTHGEAVRPHHPLPLRVEINDSIQGDSYVGL